MAPLKSFSSPDAILVTFLKSYDSSGANRLKQILDDLPEIYDRPGACFL